MSKQKSSLAVVILAAGRGTRMKSARPKVLHEIGGLPLVAHVVKTAMALKPARIVVVTGPGMDDVAAAVKPHRTVVQKSRKGTADAVKAALPALAGTKISDILILYGDVPLVEADDLRALIAARHGGKKTGLSVAAMRPEEPGGYGRMILNKDGSLKKIVEAKDASAAELRIDLCNAGFMCVDARRLAGWIGKIGQANAQKEFYLTDLPAIAAKDGYAARVHEMDAESAGGINDRIDLVLAESAFQNRRRLAMLEAGVTLQDPSTVYFSWDTRLAADVLVEPHVIFAPGVQVKAGAHIRAFSYLEGATVGEGAVIGPMARLRPGSAIGKGARIGNFVEVKNSILGAGVKAAHLAYIGDADVGAEANFSCGAITVNYDGVNKHRTAIGKGAMVGSNVNLVAPVKIGNDAYIATGSTITADVPAGKLAIARARQSHLRKPAIKKKKDS